MIASIRAQGCRARRPHPAAIPIPAQIRNPNPMTGRIPRTNDGTSAGNSLAPPSAIKKNPGINRRAEIASHRMPNRRTWPPMRPCRGMSGVVPSDLPHLEQNVADPLI